MAVNMFVMNDLRVVKKSLIIGINDVDGNKTFNALPHCFNSIFFIQYHIEIYHIQRILNDFIKNKTVKTNHPGGYDCNGFGLC